MNTKKTPSPNGDKGFDVRILFQFLHLTLITKLFGGTNVDFILFFMFVKKNPNQTGACPTSNHFFLVL
jgi:hypothetical protein